MRPNYCQSTTTNFAMRHGVGLGDDEMPLAQMMNELRDSYAELIARLPANESDQDVRELLQNRLAEYIVLVPDACPTIC